MEFPATKTTKDAIREVIGHLAVFVIQGDETACPVCSSADLYDGVNEVSLDSFCTTCSGAYWLTEDVASGVVAHVRWRTEDQPDMQQTGETLIGDCFVTIPVDALTSSQIDKIKEIRVDSRKIQPYRTIYRGAPTRDRVRFVCREFGKE
jgi:hypothetical protein